MDEALMLADVFEAKIKYRQDDVDAAQRQLDRVLERLDLAAVREHGPPIRRVVARRAVRLAAGLSRSRQDFVAGKRWSEIALELRRSTGENEVPALGTLADISLELGDVASAERYLTAIPDNVSKKDEAWRSYEWAVVAEKRGEWLEAQRLGVLALEQFTRLGHRGGMQRCQGFLARLEEHRDHAAKGASDPETNGGASVHYEGLVRK
jgi:hypothetical protein